MKRYIFIFIGVLGITSTMKMEAQEEGKVSINAVIVDEIPVEAAHYLQTKMQQALVTGGASDYGYTERFVMTAKINVTQKDIAPTTPARISQKLEITFFIGDVVANKLYESCSLSVVGIGTNETKSFISAFQKINARHPELQAMITAAKKKIVDYFTQNCHAILANAGTLASMEQYEEAIYQLMTVPNTCEDCYKKCQQQAAVYYHKQINNETMDLLNKARTEWLRNPTAEGATVVADILGRSNPRSSYYSEVVKFRNSVSAKLQADARREWQLKIKQYEDSQAFKRSIVEGCRDIGMAWAKNQPTTIYKSIIRSWW